LKLSNFMPMHSKNTQAQTRSLSLVALLLMAGIFLVAKYFGQSSAANLTSVSVTTTNSRPSFRGALTSGNNAGSSIAIINTTPGAFASTSTAQLVEGDVVRIGSAGALNPYTVASTSSLSTFSLTSVLASGDEDEDDDVISTASAVLNVRFTTVSALTDGSFRILVPSIGGSASSDGIPDGGGFDFGTTTPTVTCPDTLTGYDFTGGDASAAHSVTLDGVSYHAYTCTYTGAGAVGTDFDGTTNDYIQISNVINPAPATGHTTGTADTYSVIVQHLDSGDNVIDSTTAKIGVIEAVKITAYVAPQISFQIIGVAATTSVCGAATSVTTTPATVPFGDLSIGSFKTAAQALSVSTNASSGYAVTAAENDQLGRSGGACAGDPTTVSNGDCIQDVRGNSGNATISVSDEWTSASQPGFGYSLSDTNSTVTEAFAYDESSRTFSARQFADLENSEAPQTIFSDSTVASNDNIHVCYKIMPDATTAAGNYENYITYTATATF
jgi:hypothetical protein